MDTNAVNVAQGNLAVLSVNTETVTYHREPPPPYDSISVVTTEPRPIIQQIIIQPSLKNSPTYFHCPACQHSVLTKVVFVNTRQTHMLAGFICGFTCWCMLCCLAAIPYLIPACKKAEHYCPNCDLFLGSYPKV